MLIILLQIFLRIIIVIIFAKNLRGKLRDIVPYYLAITDYYINFGEKNHKKIALFLLTLEMSIILGMFFNEIITLICILGIVNQIIYLYSMINNYNKKMANTCSCYIVNLPHEVSLLPILYNIGIIYIFILLLII
ncbi:hypothetical protein [Anaerocolumna chitinilytica]|uniref:Methylamine utilization protein MauE n=1 Tax=Anaerocolumna chitinilytica TaxID=1727145 RepID=A0A7I8DKX6_9FIRM|nr:hypothetical protein [Anaerocolumna chitinilytica]BCJ98347.1 hypothetical protein bsdcttw_13880 [Anaerocolumna chitinilytica]